MENRARKRRARRRVFKKQNTERRWKRGGRGFPRLNAGAQRKLTRARRRVIGQSLSLISLRMCDQKAPGDFARRGGETSNLPPSPASGARLHLKGGSVLFKKNHTGETQQINRPPQPLRVNRTTGHHLSDLMWLPSTDRPPELPLF